MRILFIILIIFSILFFIAKWIVSFLWIKKKESYYNNFVIKCLNDSSNIVNIILLYCLSLSLYLAGDYTIKECNFTLIVLIVIIALYLGEKVYYHIKNRHYFYIQSNIYDLRSLVSKVEFSQVLMQKDKENFVLLDREKFEQLLKDEETADTKKLFKDKLIKICLVNGIWILVAISILLLGILRG